MRCSNCASDEELSIPGPHPGGHHTRVVCAACNRFKRWGAKPESERVKRPAAHRELAKKYGKGMCSMCGKPESQLAEGRVLEAHHIIEFEKGGTNDRENILIVCTACHKLIHWLRQHWE